MKKSNRSAAPKTNNWVLAAGGWYIFFHCGVAQAAEELGVSIADSGNVLGASAGALAATFLKNGYKGKDLVPIFIELRNARWNPINVAKMYNPAADSISLEVGGLFRMKPFMDDVVRKYSLVFKPGLRILACAIETQQQSTPPSFHHGHEAVIFEKPDCDLSFALSASGAVPSLLQPLWYEKDGERKLLVDGGVYHLNPTEFTNGTAIVSKFSRATQMPPFSEFQTPVDLYLSWREVYYPLFKTDGSVDETKHVVIETGFPNATKLNAGLSEATCWRMFESGYNTAIPILTKAIADGRIVSSKKAAARKVKRRGR
jgi:hypothetical protein